MSEPLFRSVAITCEVAAPVLNALVPPPVPTLNLVPCCPTAVFGPTRDS